MQAVETLNEGLKRTYTLTIARKEIDAHVDGELKRIAPQVRMPGFRPGKVPANLVRKMHGPALERDALEASIRDGVQKLIADKKLRPAMQPAVELDEDYAPGKDAEVKVAVEVLPDVGKPSIDGLKLERLIVPVTDADVDTAVARIAGQNKRFDPAPKSRKAAAGDQVVMAFEGKVDGKPFDGGKGEGMAVELGSGQLIPGFEDGLLGVKAGDSRTIDVRFPDDYGSSALAGKPATFDVTVDEVRIAGETVADDAFAKQLGLSGIDQLRELLRGQIEQEHAGLTRTHMKRKLLDQLAASHDFDVPPSMVEAEFKQIWQQLDHEAGHEPDPDAARAEMEGDRAEYQSIAERRVRLGLLLSEIGQANGVVIADAEMNRLIADASQRYAPEDRQKFVDYIRQDPMAAAQLRAPLYEDKVVDYLFAKAEVGEREVTRAEIEAEIEAEADSGHVHGPDCGHDHDEPSAKPAAKTTVAKKTAPKKAKTEAAAEPAKPARKPKAKSDADDDAASAKPKTKAAAAPAVATEPAKPKRKPAARKRAAD